MFQEIIKNNLFTPLEQFEVLQFLSTIQIKKISITFSLFSNLFIDLIQNIFIFIFVFSCLFVQNKYIFKNKLILILQNLKIFFSRTVYTQTKKIFTGYENFTFGLFLNLLFLNTLGIIPFSTTETAQLLPIFLASLAIFLVYNSFGILKHKLEFFNMFFPAGSPFNLAFLIIPIEFVSYTFRVISISVRLFANMMAGHTLLKVIAGFAFEIFGLAGIELYAVTFIVGVLILLSFLEFSVAIIQTYVYVTLAQMYYSDAVFLH